MKRMWRKRPDPNFASTLAHATRQELRLDDLGKLMRPEGSHRILARGARRYPVRQ